MTSSVPFPINILHNDAVVTVKKNPGLVMEKSVLNVTSNVASEDDNSDGIVVSQYFWPPKRR